MQIAAAVAEASTKTDERVKAMLQQKAQEVVSKLDLKKALSLDLSHEQIVQDAVQQTAAKLQSEGGLANLASPDQQQRSDSPVQVEHDYSQARLAPLSTAASACVLAWASLSSWVAHATRTACHTSRLVA